MKIRQIFLALVFVLTVGQAHASLLTVSFADAAGDATPDLLSAELIWNDTTGNFTLDYIFSAAAPFIGTANFNLNMLNGDMNAADPDAFVTINRCCSINEITSLVETTLITVTGTELGLMSWQVGDRIANDDVIFGLPPNVTNFFSGVSSDNFDPAFAVVQSVPEPAALSLLGLGLAGLGFSRRKKV